MADLLPFEDPTRRCLKVHEWPETDQSLWHALFEPGDILDGTAGAGCRWGNATREKYRKGYGRWLTFLIWTKRLDGSSNPPDRVTPDCVRCYMENLEEDGIAQWTIWGRIAELLAVVKAFSPESDWSWLRRIVRFMEANSHDSRNKIPRLRPAAEIANWAYIRMDEILASTPLKNAHTQYRDAFMIGLLINCPTMRLRNLTMIEIDRHLRDGKGGYHLYFLPGETKTNTAMSIPVPDSLTAYIGHYIDEVRSRLLQGSDSNRLWITKYGLPMKEKTIYDRLTKVTKRVFGEPINPHLFRDCAATTIAIDDPAHVGTASHLLGHNDPRTTEKHYIQANSLAAGRRLRKSVDALRKRYRPKAVRKNPE